MIGCHKVHNKMEAMMMVYLLKISYARETTEAWWCMYGSENRFITGRVIVRHSFGNKPIPYPWRLLMQLDYVKNKHQRHLDKKDDFFPLSKGAVTYLLENCPICLGPVGHGE